VEELPRLTRLPNRRGTTLLSRNDPQVNPGRPAHHQKRSSAGAKSIWVDMIEYL
jgi:hypothetical protein